MATRPVFVSGLNGKFCEREYTDFEYFSGFSIKQQQRCIQSLHRSFLLDFPGKKVLEISSKSEDEKGIQLSAFNLKIPMKSGKLVTVEAAFQAGKIFEHGGPFTDILEMSSRDAKKDARLRTSGQIIGFTFDGEEFNSNPSTFFYNWIYINALQANPTLADYLMEFDAFTDIAFNPEKSLNCQAEAAAIYVALRKENLLEQALKSKEDFLQIVYFSRLQKKTESSIFKEPSVKKISTPKTTTTSRSTVQVSTTSVETTSQYHSRFHVGDGITHPKFGKGVILEIVEKPTSATLTIQFSEKKVLDEQWVLKNCK